MKSKSVIYSLYLLIYILILGSCTPKNEPTPLAVTPLPTITPTVYDPMPSGDDRYPWWNQIVFYEIFVRSFYDSDGDGIGDFKGLTEKLDYLNDGDPNTITDLGINGIWLMPIFPSPSYHGYDVIDYRAINPDYGTIQDFQIFLEEAHQRGIRVIIDFVINHTSTENPWFTDARSDLNSPYRDWYIWSEEKLTYLGPWDQNVWHFNIDNQYYYGIFWSGMPDLNYKNPFVTEEILEIADYWLTDVGVDGFRVDGARHLIEDGEVQENTSETHDWFKKFYAFYKEKKPLALSVGEVWDSNFAAVQYVKNEEFDLVFDFELSESILEGINGRNAKKIMNALEFNTGLYPDYQKANFLTNHDMNRVMNVFQENDQKGKIAATILFTAPGVPFVYYGEEVGMRGSKPDEDIRRPMQWTAGDQAGFTDGIAWRNLNSNSDTWNVETLALQQGSIFNLYRSLIHLRNEEPALKTGKFQLVDTNNSNIVAFYRFTTDQVFLVLINLSENIQEIEFENSYNVFQDRQYKWVNVFNREELGSISVVSDTDNTMSSSIILQPEAFIVTQFVAE
jgi:glycosidase